MSAALKDYILRRRVGQAGGSYHLITWQQLILVVAAIMPPNAKRDNLIPQIAKILGVSFHLISKKSVLS